MCVLMCLPQQQGYCVREGCGARKGGEQNFPHHLYNDVYRTMGSAFLWVGKMLECSEAKVASRRGTRRERHLSETE